MHKTGFRRRGPAGLWKAAVVLRECVDSVGSSVTKIQMFSFKVSGTKCDFFQVGVRKDDQCL